MFLVLVMMVALFACVVCRPEPVAGTITAKEFVSAHTDSGLLMIPMAGGGFMYLPSDTSCPELHNLQVTTSSGKVLTVTVSKNQFDAAKVGDHYEEKK